MDLFVLSREVCKRCYGYDVFVIGNGGTVPHSGGFDLVVSNGTRFHVSEEIPSGGASYPVMVTAVEGFESGAPVQLRVESAVTECNTTNNDAELIDARGICDP